MVDSFSKYVMAQATSDLSAETIAQVLFNVIFTRFGPPQVLVSDNAPNYQSKVVAHLCKLHDTDRSKLWLICVNYTIPTDCFPYPIVLFKMAKWNA